MVKLGGNICLSTCEMRKVLATYVSDVRPSFPMQVIQNATLLTRARSKHVSAIIMLFIVLEYGFNHVWEKQGVGDETIFL